MCENFPRQNFRAPAPFPFSYTLTKKPENGEISDFHYSTNKFSQNPSHFTKIPSETYPPVFSPYNSPHSVEHSLPAPDNSRRTLIPAQVPSAPRFFHDMPSVPPRVSPIPHNYDKHILHKPFFKNPPDLWRIETLDSSPSVPTPEEKNKWRVHRWTQNGWKISSLEEFFQDFPLKKPIYIYVHGNRTSTQDASEDGIHLLNILPCEIPPRFVIWNWNTDRETPRIRMEYRGKAFWADVQGVYLAYFLKDLPLSQKVTLLGYSFGARSVLTALHLCGGGDYYNYRIYKPGVNIPDHLFYAILIATPAASYELMEKNRFSKVTWGAQKIIFTVNPSDPALRFYPKIDENKEKAFGVTGIPQNIFSSGAPATFLPILLNLKSHKFRDYLKEPAVQKILCP
ncbi:MAG: hypothetical protein Q4C96_02415 [Planctomycetia bacterium]|nr:hypothetical protein [Planctomycetia bacterium]